MALSRWISSALVGLIVLAPASSGAHQVCLYGSYYKERSTRVVSPMVEIQADLPWQSEVSVGYLIDQITSASAAFSPGEDRVFQEYRHEVSVGLASTFLGMLTPSVAFRYSDEPDYKSIGVSASLAAELFDEQTTLVLRLGFLRDSARFQRLDPTAPDLREPLSTGLIGVGVTQVLTPVLLAGLDLETQIARGFQENQYRANEVHPRERNRYAVSAWAAYRIEPSRTTIRIDYRFYADTWKLRANSAELRVTQRIVPSLEIEPRFRFHLQNAVFFIDGRTVDDMFFDSEDPKLTAFNAQTFGLQLSWRLSILEDTFLDVFSEVLIQPYYAFLRQTNRYGNAHIAQLGMFWPFDL